MAAKQGGSRDVFVGSLPDNIDEETIRQLFLTIGDVQSVHIKEGKNNMSKFCFVRYYNEDNVDTAIAKLNGQMLNGRTIAVKTAGKNRQKTDGGAPVSMNRQQENRNFQGQRRPQQGGGGYRPWGDAGPDREDFRQWEEELKVSKGRICHIRLAATTEVEAALREVVALTHVVDANTIYAQICNPETAAAYQNMITQLFTHCSNLPPAATEINPNQIYGAIFSADNGWYRCTVKGQDPATGKMSVLFVDYGNEETVDSVVILPDSLTNIPFFAVKMSLWGLEACFPNKTSENAKKAAEFLSSLSEAETKVRISNQQPNLHECSVVLFLEGQNVNETIFNNFADKRPSPAISPPVIQQEGSGGGPYQGGGGGGPRAPPQRGWSSSPPMGGSPGESATTAAMVGQLQNEKATLIQKVHELKIELQVVKSSKDIEVTGFKEKLDQAIDYKVATALGSLRRVKKARVLYPRTEDKKAPLEGAIDILHGGQVTLNGEQMSFRDATPNVASVEEQLEHLSTCQDLIRNCSDKEELSPLILDRNQARLEAFQAMKGFLDISDQLPINSRLSDLQNMLTQVTNSYPSMVQPLTPPEGPADEIYEQYRAWLDLKTKKLKSYWKETESALGTWAGMTSSMQQSFSLSGDSDFEAQNMDACIQHLLVAMETELVISCQGYEPHITLNPEILKQREAELQLEKEVLKNTVQTVLRDTGEEATRLRQLATHCMRYKGMMADLEGWLEATPNTDALQALQKKIKVARSKLRHLLVDLRDGEEDPDLLGDKTVEELRGDIATYQQQLLDHYTKEDELLSNLAQLTKEHFPELAMLHTNLGLQKYIETDGLIKEGRDLMHFDLSAFPSCTKTTTKLASIGDKGIAVIKSQHLPDLESQRTFLERVQLYKTISSPLLLPVYGIVPDADSSQYHLQLWYHATGSLTQVMTSDTPLSQGEILARLKDILLALQTLHNIQFFHGAVHPNNVLFETRETVILAEYEFSKLPIERGKSAYTSSNGLSFQAPEIKHGVAASTASDIFSFGILVLWTHYPTSPFTTLANGTPNLEGLPIPRDLVNFVGPMLHHNPTNRPSVKHILDFGYLDRLVGVPEEEEGAGANQVSEGSPEGVTEVDPADEGSTDGGLVEQGPVGAAQGGNAGKEEIAEGLPSVPLDENGPSAEERGEDPTLVAAGQLGPSEGQGSSAVVPSMDGQSSDDIQEQPLSDGKAQVEDDLREGRFVDAEDEQHEPTAHDGEGDKQAEQPDGRGTSVDSIKNTHTLTNGSVESEGSHDQSSNTPPPLLDD